MSPRRHKPLLAGAPFDVRVESVVVLEAGPALVTLPLSPSSQCVHSRGMCLNSLCASCLSQNCMDSSRHVRETAQRCRTVILHDESRRFIDACTVPQFTSLMMMKIVPDDTTAQDDQEDAPSSPRGRRQISKIHENMRHPSNRTGTSVTSRWSRTQIYPGSRQAQVWCW